jgi:hypothetical protein
MRQHASGKCQTISWEEKPYSEVPGGTKPGRATVVTSFLGDIDGEGTSEYLMAYSDQVAENLSGWTV